MEGRMGEIGDHLILPPALEEGPLDFPRQGAEHTGNPVFYHGWQGEPERMGGSPRATQGHEETHFSLVDASRSRLSGVPGTHLSSQLVLHEGFVATFRKVL